MKTLICLIMLFSLVACSSSQKKMTEEDQMIQENLIKDDVILGDKLPEWIKEEGIQGNLLIKVGKYEGDAANYMEDALEELAFADARSKLVSKMPMDFKMMVQKSLSSSGQMSLNKVETSMGQLLGVTGFDSSGEFSTCRKVIRQTKYSSKVNRICYVRASIPIENLNDAIIESVKSIYGRDKADKFKQVMDKNMEDFLSKNSSKGVTPIEEKVK